MSDETETTGLCFLITYHSSLIAPKENAARHHVCRVRRVLVKSVCAYFCFRVGALRITPHAAARMTVVAMMVVRCGVGVVRHALNFPV